MIETIVLIENGTYPFGQTCWIKKLVKVEDIRSYSSAEQLKQQKLKMQSLFNSCDKSSQTTISSAENVHFIKLIKIYQQDLSLHFIYEYVPYSLNQYIQNRIYGQSDIQKTQILEMNSKLFLKKVYYQLGAIVNFLIKGKIKVNLEYQHLGIDQQQNLKFFIDPNCQILASDSKPKQDDSNPKQDSEKCFSSQQIEAELRLFYDWTKEEILAKLQRQFKKMKRRQQYVPNFVIKGNQLIFCKNTSEASSQCYSPSPSSISSFTQRSDSFNTQFFCPVDKDEDDSNIRKTHGNLFTKLKKTQSYNYQNQSSKKLQQSRQKLQNLKKKSNKLNEELKNNYLSSSQNFPAPRMEKNDEDSNNRHSSGQASQIFNKRSNAQTQQQVWRNSQIPGNLRKNHIPNVPSSKSANRFGMNFDGKRSKSNRDHKSSFQFKQNQREKQWFNPNKSFDKSYDQEFPDKSFQQTKSIRIELEQSTRNKQRKNSYKVKILTCQQMQLDGDNVQEFVFNAMNRNFDTNKGEENEQNENDQSNQSQSGQQSNRSQSSKYSNRYQNMFSEKFKASQRNQQNFSKYSQSPVKNHIKQRQRDTSGQKNIFEKYYEQFGNDNQKSSKNQKLQQKIKLAKQKAEDVLNKYMKNKKYSNKTQTSKFVP